MPTSRLQQVAQHFRAQLRTHEAAAQGALDSSYTATLARVQPALQQLYAQIAAKQKDGEKIPPSWLYEKGRLEALKQQIEAHFNQYGSIAQHVTQQQQITGVTMGTALAQQQLQATVPTGVQYTFGMPSHSAIQGLVGATQKGSPLNDLFQGFGTEAAQNVSQALVTGLALGNNPRQVARDVQNALGVSRARALVISRSELNRAYRSAAFLNYRANDDVVQGWIWQCALLKTSCAACVAMNGTRHSLDEELQDHPCGSCAPIPETKDWADILGPLGIDTSNIPSTTIEVQSGEDWFAEQDEEIQKNILGSQAAFDLYNSGKATLQDFVGYNSSEDWGQSIYQKSAKALVK
jgi:hypothetical protein